MNGREPGLPEAKARYWSERCDCMHDMSPLSSSGLAVPPVPGEAQAPTRALSGNGPFNQRLSVSTQPLKSVG